MWDLPSAPTIVAEVMLASADVTTHSGLDSGEWRADFASTATRFSILPAPDHDYSCGYALAIIAWDRASDLGRQSGRTR
jgi:hypothetical protein